MKVLRAYRYGKFIDLFADVNVKLRNAIAHSVNSILGIPKFPMIIQSRE